MESRLSLTGLGAGRRGGLLDRRLLIPLVLVVGLLGAAALVWSVPSTEPAPPSAEEPAAAGTAPTPVEPGRRPDVDDAPDDPELHPRQSALPPVEVPDPLGREVIRSQPPVDDPGERDAMRKRHEHAIAQKQHAITVAFLEEQGVTGGEASRVLRAVFELSDELARIRAEIQGGTLTPAEGREAIREARESTRAAVEDVLGAEAAGQLGARMTQVGGGF